MQNPNNLEIIFIIKMTVDTLIIQTLEDFFKFFGIAYSKYDSVNL